VLATTLDSCQSGAEQPSMRLHPGGLGARIRGRRRRPLCCRKPPTVTHELTPQATQVTSVPDQSSGVPAVHVRVVSPESTLWPAEHVVVQTEPTISPC
jgi:hypothetical protein